MHFAATYIARLVISKHHLKTLTGLHCRVERDKVFHGLNGDVLSGVWRRIIYFDSKTLDCCAISRWCFMVQNYSSTVYSK